jgi:hypothetical protein
MISYFSTWEGPILKSLYIYFSIFAVYLYAQFLSDNDDFKVFTNYILLVSSVVFLIYLFTNKRNP